MKNTRVRAIADTAVASAIGALFIIIMVYVAPLSALMSFTIGIPIVYIAFKWDWRFACLCAVCSALSAFVLIGDILSLGLIMLIYALPSLAFGICISKGIKTSGAVAASALTSVVGLVAELVLLNGDGNGILNLIKGVTDNMEQTLGVAVSQAGVLPEGDVTVMISEMVEKTADMFMLYLPSFVIIGAAIYSYCSSAFSLFVLKRIGLKNIPNMKFYMLKASKSMCIVMIVLFIICTGNTSSGVYMAALENLLFILTSAIAVCGLAAIDYKLKNSIKSGYVRAIIYISVFFTGFAFASVITSVLTVVGFVDGMRGMRSVEKVGGKNEN